MNKPKGYKRQRRRGKAQPRGPGARGKPSPESQGQGASPAQSPRGKGRAQPGILESWEGFSEAALRDYLEAVAEDFSEQLDALEDALRCEN